MITKKCFNGDAFFERNRFTAFESFLNRDRESAKVNMAEMLATYSDHILRKGGSKLPES